MTDREKLKYIISEKKYQTEPYCFDEFGCEFCPIKKECHSISRCIIKPEDRKFLAKQKLKLKELDNELKKTYFCTKCGQQINKTELEKAEELYTEFILDGVENHSNKTIDMIIRQLWKAIEEFKKLK